MNKKLFEREERFQPYLLHNDYTFIGPADKEDFDAFFKIVNLRAPVVAFPGSFYHALLNKQAVHTVVNELPDLEYRIYAVIPDPVYLLHATLEEYCTRNSIEFS